MIYVACDECGDRLDGQPWYRVTPMRLSTVQPGEPVEGRSRDVCAACMIGPTEGAEDGLA